VRKLIKRLWTDQVWSKVIASGIVAAVAAFFAYRWWTPIIAGVVATWHFLGDTTPVMNWLLIVLVLCTLGVGGILVLAVLADRMPKEPARRWQDYLSDEFHGIRWRWRYSSTDSIRDVCPFCPQCDMQISPHPSAYIGAGITVFECDNCSFERRIEREYDGIEHLIQRSIQQKLRNNSWKLMNG
jgi:hypothetical protein